MTTRRFILRRDTDETGVSGAGDVAEGVEFSDGVIALRWTTAWPTSVVFHDRGLESVQAVHGHGGKTRVIWLDGDVVEDIAPAPPVVERIDFEETITALTPRVLVRWRPGQELQSEPYHVGRAWAGHTIEDSCPCTKAACGLVSHWAEGCVQHDPVHARTIRQSHRADMCPGATS